MKKQLVEPGAEGREGHREGRGGCCFNSKMWEALVGREGCVFMLLWI